jgi:hypothetical protein
MGLDEKLARLGVPLSTAERTATAAKPDRATIDALRQKMIEILGRPTLVPRPPADPSATLLPFARVEAEHGLLYRRLDRLAPSHHVGRMPVEAAASARAELLALLALDPGLASCDVRGAVFVDTETTGLGGGAGIIAFLVGLAWFDADGHLVVEQLLLRSPADERAMLRRLTEVVQNASMLVTYNGKTFDLPLLAGRYVMNHLPPLPVRPHLDLLHVARRLHRRRLGVCRLVNLEADVLGFVRDRDIDGGEVAPRYAHFLRTGDEEALRLVVDHNAWDVVSLAALVALYGEPLSTLHDEDLVGLARVFRRAGALDAAVEAAEAAVTRGAGVEALRVRGQIHKARGDRARALADFEALQAEVDDPPARLELAKLYEHYVKEPLRALDVVMRGTDEPPEATARRRARLERKVARNAERRTRCKPRRPPA